MKIGISGVSGKLGRQVLQTLLQTVEGSQLVGISRSPDTVQGGVEARHGDYDDAGTLATAYHGIDRLLIIPSADLRPGVRGTQFKAAISAAQQAGVQHIVLMSASGTKQAADATVAGAYWQGEQHLIKTAASWTILRMNYYAESMIEEIQQSAGRGMLVGFGQEQVGYVSREDVAAAAAAILTGDDHAGAIYTATGPAVLSGEERAALGGAALGMALAYASVPPEQFRQGMAAMGLPALVIDAVVEIKTNFVKGSFDIVTGDVQRLTGRRPQAFGEVLSAMLGKSAA